MRGWVEAFERDAAVVLRSAALRRHAADELELARASAEDARAHAQEAHAALLRALELEGRAA